MTLRVEGSIVPRPAQSPQDVATAAAAGTSLDITFSQYVGSGIDPALPPQQQAIVSALGTPADLATFLDRLYLPTFAVVRPGKLLTASSEAQTAAQGTNIAVTRNWSNGNVSPVRTGCLFTPNGPGATARPNYLTLLQRLDTVTAAR